MVLEGTLADQCEQRHCVGSASSGDTGNWAPPEDQNPMPRETVLTTLNDLDLQRPGCMSDSVALYGS